MRATWTVFATLWALWASPCLSREYSAEEIRRVFQNMRAAKEGGIAEVLQRMKSASFEEREAAQRELEGMFWVSAEWIASQANKDDPELRYRLENIGRRAEQTGLDIVGSIKTIGTEQFLPELFELGSSISRERDLWNAVLQLLQDHSGKATNKDTLRLNLGHRHAQFRQVALTLLVRSFPDAGKEAAVALLKDPDERVQLAAVDALVRSGDKRGAERAIRLLSCKDMGLRWQAYSLLVALAGEKIVPFDENPQPNPKSQQAWNSWLADQPSPVPLPEGGIDEMAIRLTTDGVRTAKPFYLASEEIVVEVDQFSGSSTDWVTIVEEGAAETSYGQYFYGEGKRTGRFTFAGLPVGKYEVRVYHDWPAGGYEVKSRSSFRVIAR